MKKVVFVLIFLHFQILGFSIPGIPEYNNEIFNKIKISRKDIPNGYIYGKVPPFAQKVLKSNPWLMDKHAIKKLTKQIYPGGSYLRIESIHVTILAPARSPFGDDIVCYIILYNSTREAKKEIEKISNFVNINKDRAILLTKKNLAVFFHVDDVSNFNVIRSMSMKVEKILETQ